MSKIRRRRQGNGNGAETTSTDGRLVPFDAGAASDDELREVFDFLALAAVYDGPPSLFEKSDQDRYDAFVRSLFRRGAPEPNGSMSFLLLRGYGRIAVSVAYAAGGGADGDAVLIDITVHPGLREKGTGTAVLRAMIPVVRAMGRSRIAATVRSGAFEKWAWNLGFRPVVRQAVQYLVVSDADAALWEDVPVPVGYRLESWGSTTPERLLESYARARRGFEDLLPPRFTAGRDWSPQHIREDEADSAARNAECRVVVAIHEATGEIVGMTETAVFAAEPGNVTQACTAVLREHQGTGLGRAMKAAMTRRLLGELSGDFRITTRALGDRMMRLNRSLGYQTEAEYAFVEVTVDQLERTFAALS